jgi:peptide/nickel transport system permease protein
MISSAMQNTSAWWLGVFPGLAILTVVMAFNFIGDSLRDALDPLAAAQEREADTPTARQSETQAPTAAEIPA